MINFFTATFSIAMNNCAVAVGIVSTVTTFWRVTFLFLMNYWWHIFDMLAFFSLYFNISRKKITDSSHFILPKQPEKNKIHECFLLHYFFYIDCKDYDARYVYTWFDVFGNRLSITIWIFRRILLNSLVLLIFSLNVNQRNEIITHYYQKWPNIYFMLFCR